MSVYRFRVTFEDHPDVIRVIDIDSSSTFEDFHKAILSSVGFDKTQLASFYLSDENWEKGMEITLLEMEDELEEESDLLVMSKTKIADVVSDQVDKLVYVYDFVLLWTFHVEFEGKEEKETGVRYPHVVEVYGDAPDQYEDTDRYPDEVTDEDEDYINTVKKKNKDYLLDDYDDDFDDEYSEELEDDFEDYADDDNDYY